MVASNRKSRIDVSFAALGVTDQDLLDKELIKRWRMVRGTGEMWVWMFVAILGGLMFIVVDGQHTLGWIVIATGIGGRILFSLWLYVKSRRLSRDELIDDMEFAREVRRESEIL